MSGKLPKALRLMGWRRIDLLCDSERESDSGEATEEVRVGPKAEVAQD
jgi:hypothetical protein